MTKILFKHKPVRMRMFLTYLLKIENEKKQSNTVIINSIIPCSHRN